MVYCMHRPALAAQAILTLTIVSLAALHADASLIVNPARPITRKLEVQIIRTSLDGRLLPATVLGNASQQSAIEAGVDTIWAQAGIDVEFLPSVTAYADTFAYQGALQPRPTGDLPAMVNNARAAGKLNPDPQVLNMFFVNIAPGFNLLSQSTVAGMGFINGNGVAMFVGDSLLTFDKGRDIVAGVVAHEIGHNLGLTHTATGGANLMSPSGASEQLTPQQIETALRSSLLQTVTKPGDFNGDGYVDAADLMIWRGAYGVHGGGDADGDNDTDGVDLLLWQKHFSGGRPAGFSAIPEPATGSLALGCTVGLLTLNLWRRRRV